MSNRIFLPGPQQEGKAREPEAAPEEEVAQQHLRDLTSGELAFPIGRGLLIEVLYQDKSQKLDFVGGNTRNTSRAVVRAASPHLPETLRGLYLPDGGHVGTGMEVVVSKNNTFRLRKGVYDSTGQPEPDLSQGLGDLAYVSFEEVIGIMKEASIEGAKSPEDYDGPLFEREDIQQLPFQKAKDDNVREIPFMPMGGRVVFDYTYKEDSARFVDGEGNVFEDKDDPEAEGRILLPERSKAHSDQTATVNAVGPDTRFLEAGDRIIVNRFVGGISVDGEEYPMIGSEAEARGVIRAVDSFDSEDE